MNQKELNLFKKSLSEKREDLLKLVNNSRKNDEAETTVGDEADIASESIEKEMIFELNDNERLMLDSIEAALRKIENATFGQCDQCKKKIGKERLKAIPFARFCIQCQSRVET
ncbi:MAG: TraR/DksA family transcriptional regulator [bacterium]